MAILANGNLRKLHTTAQNPVAYHLPVGSHFIPLNPLLGKVVYLAFSGRIHCIACGRLSKKSYHQGYCYPCSQTLAECDLCIVRPERCHYHQGTCRQPEWGEAHCMQSHYVYLANTSAPKVGITRNQPTRWMDQGAAQALPIFQVQTRFQAGQIEVILGREIADKTDWRKLLKGAPQAVDLLALRDSLRQRCAPELTALPFTPQALEGHDTPPVSCFTYPILHYPGKIVALNFDKTPHCGGILQGIKGQYLLFDSGVLNVRKFSGYEVEVQDMTSFKPSH